MTRLHLVFAAALAATISPALAQSHAHRPGMDHAAMMAAASAQPTEPGQSAFAAIAEIVEILRADPHTDWTKVSIEGLRQHLADMDAVTLRAAIAMEPKPEGAIFEATATDPAIAAAIKRMTLAHAAAMSGYEDMIMEAEAIPGGARLSVAGPNPDMIRGLGFIGVMTLGMHHQAHHLALARGRNPHAH